MAAFLINGFTSKFKSWKQLFLIVNSSDIIWRVPIEHFCKAYSFFPLRSKQTGLHTNRVNMLQKKWTSSLHSSNKCVPISLWMKSKGLLYPSTLFNFSDALADYGPHTAPAFWDIGYFCELIYKEQINNCSCDLNKISLFNF